MRRSTALVILMLLGSEIHGQTDLGFLETLRQNSQRTDLREADSTRLLEQATRWFDSNADRLTDQQKTEATESYNLIFLRAQKARLQREVFASADLRIERQRRLRQVNQLLNRTEDLSVLLGSRRLTSLVDVEIADEAISEQNGPLTRKLQPRTNIDWNSAVVSKQTSKSASGSSPFFREDLGQVARQNLDRRRQQRLDSMTPEERKAELKREAKIFIEQAQREAEERRREEQRLARCRSERAQAKARFFQELGVSPQGRLPVSQDLSHMYPPPDTQASSNACAAFAAIADMAHALTKAASDGRANRSGRKYNLDVEQAYARMLGIEQIDASGEPVLPRELKGKLRGGFWESDLGVQSVHDAIASLQQQPSCETCGIQAPNGPRIPFVGHLSRSEYAVNNFVSFPDATPSCNDWDPWETPPINADDLRRLVASGNPPVVGIDTDARITQEGWMRLVPGGSFRHVVNVVGYGEGLDPMTFTRKQYFIVRDSLVNPPRYVKVDADEFAKHSLELYKITSVKQLE